MRRKLEVMKSETRYRLVFKAPDALDAGATSGGDFQTLAGALSMGWLNDGSGGRSLGITCGGMPVMNEEDLRRAFERLRAIESECPGGNVIACAERVLREMGLE
jgi:hypothetical protein